MNLRTLRRAVALGLVLGAAVIRYWMLRFEGPLTLERRARWLHETCILVLRNIGGHCSIEGKIPTHGLVVANHLSYLDIVVLSAAMPCFFVAKSEIDRWLYFGKAARSGGTLFIERGRRASAESVAEMIRERLKLPVPVLLFPEGTSTDGTMQRFHSTLLEPAIRERAPVTAVAVRYVSDDATAERELCWYGDDALAPHLMKTLKAAGFHAELCFGEPRLYRDRRTAAAETFAEIAAFREGRTAEALEQV